MTSKVIRRLLHSILGRGIVSHRHERRSDFTLVSDGSAWIKATGDISQPHAVTVKEFSRNAVRRGIFEFVVDLRAWTGMDEVFMGALVGVAPTP